MSGDLIALLIRTQVVASAAIAVLLIIRRLRLPLDPDARLWLWLVPLGAAFVSMFPEGAPSEGTAGLWAVPSAFVAQVLVAVWLTGAAAALIWVAAVHLAFLREVKRGRAGPAVVGVAYQRVVMPAAPIFEPAERALIRAHEWEHIRRNDVAIRYLLTLAQCLFWFNPLMHAAAAELRLDQELACDETVVRRLGQRRRYAQTLLKCHTGQPSPLGCHWLGRGVHPLEARLAALAARPASEGRRELVTMLGVAAGMVAIVAAHMM
jgi:hypothetical protein